MFWGSGVDWVGIVSYFKRFPVLDQLIFQEVCQDPNILSIFNNN